MESFQLVTLQYHIAGDTFSKMCSLAIYIVLSYIDNMDTFIGITSRNSGMYAPTVRWTFLIANFQIQELHVNLFGGDIIFPLQAGLAERGNNEKISLDHLALFAWFYTIICEKQYKNPVD